MSLEEALREHTEALRENTEMLRTITAKAKDGMAAQGTSKKSSGSDGDGDAAEAPKRGRGRPAGSRNSSTKSTKAPTETEMKTKAKDFLEAAESDADHLARREAVKKIAEEYEADKFSAIDEAYRRQALDTLESTAKKWTPVEDGEDDDDV
ncbi:hypothetical protein [Amorphus orientalis]|uniref:Uncharacterized protein n=1 Tax=Amorphus orientalis TaxID=649198 RepID=A0AAE3VSY2_9HYPH|nr:hypothetical protein [Amorphus orientalis]MDQ0317777.1 hypothetical protein [Amorphus orientalis]